MNVKRLLLKGVVFEIKEGKNMHVPFIYEHLPSIFCLNCVRRDHITDLCPLDSLIGEDVDLMVTHRLNPNEGEDREGPNNTIVSPHASHNHR